MVDFTLNVFFLMNASNVCMSDWLYHSSDIPVGTLVKPTEEKNQGFGAHVPKMSALASDQDLSCSLTWVAWFWQGCIVDGKELELMN